MDRWRLLSAAVVLSGGEMWVAGLLHRENTWDSSEAFQGLVHEAFP